MLFFLSVLSKSACRGGSQQPRGCQIPLDAPFLATAWCSSCVLKHFFFLGKAALLPLSLPPAFGGATEKVRCEPATKAPGSALSRQRSPAGVNAHVGIYIFFNTEISERGRG